MPIGAMYAAFGREDVASGDAAYAAARAVEALLEEHAGALYKEEAAKLEEFAARLHKTAESCWSSPYAMDA